SLGSKFVHVPLHGNWIARCEAAPVFEFETIMPIRHRTTPSWHRDDRDARPTMKGAENGSRSFGDCLKIGRRWRSLDRVGFRGTGRVAPDASRRSLRARPPCRSV